MVVARRSRVGAGRASRFPSGALRVLLPLGCAALLAILVGCKASHSEPTGSAGDVSKGVAPLSAEPARFKFVVPPAYLPRELRGEGSEKLLAPADAQVLPGNQGIRVEAGNDFALEIQFQTALTSLPSAAEGAQLATSEKDVVVFKTGDAYWFVVLRELVPEWDENERHRVACASAGALAPGKAAVDLRHFTRAAVEHMVAACRTLELPRLE